MGQAMITIDAEAGLETVTVTGRVNVNNFLAVTNDENFGTQRKKLWDLTKSDLSDITTDQIITVLEHFKELDDINKAEAAAILVDNPANEVLVKLFEAISRDVLLRKIPIYIATTRDDALRWLNTMVEDHKKAS